MRPGLRSLGERCVRYMQLRGGLLIQSARGKPGRPVDVLDDSGLVLASCWPLLQGRAIPQPDPQPGSQCFRHGP
jgi:hypothetical protein